MLVDDLRTNFLTGDLSEAQLAELADAGEDHVRPGRGTLPRRRSGGAPLDPARGTRRARAPLGS